MSKASISTDSRVEKQPSIDWKSLDVSHIKGNASDDAKRLIAYPSKTFSHTSPSGLPRFGKSIVDRLELVECSIKPQKEGKMQGYAVYELTVEEDMVNGGANVHGGCSAFLIDICSSLALLSYVMHTKGTLQHMVSQTLNTVYHAPAPIGASLRIESSTLTVGGRASSAKTEIWDTTNHRLVTSGTHIKMAPSVPTAAKL